jgi:predicted TIM-barrel fold metal-dependent hydrolase
MKKSIFLLSILSFGAFTVLFGQNRYQSKYPDIPIVDVHVHITGGADVTNYLKVSDVIKQQYGSNLAYFVGFFQSRNESFADVKAVDKNRFLFAVRNFNEHKGFFDNSVEIIEKVQNGGYIGLKFWFGDPSRRLQPGEAGITRIDDPRFAPFFSKLEKANVLMTSLHIADPNGPFGDRQNWMKNPVFYWEQIRAFENVVAKYPNLTIVAAHCAWIICQDA